MSFFFFPTFGSMNTRRSGKENSKFRPSKKFREPHTTLTYPVHLLL